MNKNKIPFVGIICIIFGVFLTFLGLVGSFVFITDNYFVYEDLYLTIGFLGFGEGLIMSGLNHRVDDEVVKYLAYGNLGIGTFGFLMFGSGYYMVNFAPRGLNKFIFFLIIVYMGFGLVKIVDMIRKS